jgi:hypothetical protein
MSTVGATDRDRVPVRELLAAVDTVTFALAEPAGRVVVGQIIGVSLPPVPRRGSVTLAAARRTAKVHPAIAGEIIERKPTSAVRAPFGRWRPAASHSFPTFPREGFFREMLGRGSGNPFSRSSGCPPPGVSAEQPSRYFVALTCFFALLRAFCTVVAGGVRDDVTGCWLSEVLEREREVNSDADLIGGRRSPRLRGRPRGLFRRPL